TIDGSSLFEYSLIIWSNLIAIVSVIKIIP
ncbi:unnamed protein product, partial [marine sediment metagenome]